MRTYIAEGDSGKIRVINLSTGIIGTVASGLGQGLRLTLNSAGNVFIADGHNQRILRFDAARSTISTVLLGSGVKIGFFKTGEAVLA